MPESWRKRNSYNSITESQKSRKFKYNQENHEIPRISLQNKKNNFGDKLLHLTYKSNTKNAQFYLFS